MKSAGNRDGLGTTLCCCRAQACSWPQQLNLVQKRGPGRRHALHQPICSFPPCLPLPCQEAESLPRQAERGWTRSWADAASTWERVMNINTHRENVLEQHRSHRLEGATRWLCPTEPGSQNAPWQWTCWWLKLLGANFDYLNLEPSLLADGDSPSAVQPPAQATCQGCVSSQHNLGYEGDESLCPHLLTEQGDPPKQALFYQQINSVPLSKFPTICFPFFPCNRKIHSLLFLNKICLQF